MNRQQKTVVIDELNTDFKQSTASFLINVQGLSVVQLQQLRRGLKANGAKLKVAKGRLMKHALGAEEGGQELGPYLKEQIALVFAFQDFIPVAKVLADFSKENQALKLVVGCVEKSLMQKEQINFIAALPSRQVLLARICGSLQAPMTNLARALSMLVANRSGEAKPAE